MSVLINKRYKKTVEYTYYTEEEAQELGLNYKKNWQEAQVGDWLLTTDGYVVQCLRRETYNDKYPNLRTRDAITIPNKSWWTNGKSCYLFKKRDWDALFGREKFAREFVTTYVTMRFQGKVDYNKLGMFSRTKEAVPALFAKKTLKLRSIKKMISEEIERVLTENGVTKAFLIEKWKAAMEMAEEKKNPSIMLKAFDSMKDVVGLINRHEIKGEFTYFGDINKQIDTAEQSLLSNPEYQIEKD